MRYILVLLSVLVLIGCKHATQIANKKNSYGNVQVVGAMKDAMWKGELYSKINLDTINDKNGLYGLGPQTQLTGEILIMDGKSYVSKVTSDSTMTVKQSFDTGAPFFVYSNVTEWKEILMSDTIKDINALEIFINKKSEKMKRPFAFKISGVVTNAVIHVQNLPQGSKVSSPQEAHVGQVDYQLKDATVDIVGFFSTEHKTIFTHHDSFMHMHLITRDRLEMGHLDSVTFGKVKLYLPVN